MHKLISDPEAFMAADAVTQSRGNAAAGLSRDDVLARYRRIREIGKLHNAELVRYVSHDALLQQARRLGLAKGRNFVLNHQDEMSFVFDLVIFNGPAGRTRAIDRYARSAQLAPDSEEGVVLEAMRHARFSLFAIQRRHETAGLMLRDLLRETDVWLVDLGLEKSAPEGAVMAGRLYTPDQFSVTTGVNLPLDQMMLDKALSEIPQLRGKPPAELADDRRLAEAVYRVAVASGIMQRIGHHDPLAGAG
jgi:hypothetical protein